MHMYIYIYIHISIYIYTYIYIYIFGPHKASKRGKTDGFLTFNKKAFASQKRREAFRL